MAVTSDDIKSLTLIESELDCQTSLTRFTRGRVSTLQSSPLTSSAATAVTADGRSQATLWPGRRLTGRHCKRTCGHLAMRLAGDRQSSPAAMARRLPFPSVRRGGRMPNTSWSNLDCAGQHASDDGCPGRRHALQIQPAGLTCPVRCLVRRRHGYQDSASMTTRLHFVMLI